MKESGKVEDQKFEINGTVPEMIKTLQEDFDMSHGEAEFFVYVMINSPKGELADVIKKDELVHAADKPALVGCIDKPVLVGCIDQGGLANRRSRKRAGKYTAKAVRQEKWTGRHKGLPDRYEGRISNQHFIITFASMKKSLFHVAYCFLLKFLYPKGFDLVSIGFDLIYIIVSSITKIENTDYCIYARIVELNIGNKNRFFDENDIVTANKEGKCDYQEENWKCTYLDDCDDCTCNLEKVRGAFVKLKEQNIIREVGQKWILVQ